MLEERGPDESAWCVALFNSKTHITLTRAAS
jgi:hypothetical protein